MWMVSCLNCIVSCLNCIVSIFRTQNLRTSQTQMLEREKQSLRLNFDLKSFKQFWKRGNILVPFLLLVVFRNFTSPLLCSRLHPIDVARFLVQEEKINSRTSSFTTLVRDIYYFNEEDYLSTSNSLIFLRPRLEISYWSIQITYEHGMYDTKTRTLIKKAKSFWSGHGRTLPFFSSLVAFECESVPNGAIIETVSEAMGHMYSSDWWREFLSTIDAIRGLRVVHLLMLLFCGLSIAIRFSDFGLITTIIQLVFTVLLAIASVSKTVLEAVINSRNSLENFPLLILMTCCQTFLFLLEILELSAAIHRTTRTQPFKYPQVETFSTMDWDEKPIKKESTEIQGSFLMERKASPINIIRTVSTEEEMVPYFGPIRKPEYLSATLKSPPVQIPSSRTAYPTSCCSPGPSEVPPTNPYLGFTAFNAKTGAKLSLVFIPMKEDVGAKATEAETNEKEPVQAEEQQPTAEV